MKKRLLFILLLFIAWLPVFVIQKPVFMFYQHALAGDCSFMDYLLVMLHGTKLDCTIAGYLTAVPLLLTLVSTWLPGNWLKKVLKSYYLFTGLLVAAIFAVDVALYGFWGFRIDATLFFYLQSPTDAMASVPIGLAILQSLVFVIYASGIYAWFRWLLRFAPGKDSTAPTFGKRMGTSLAIILLGGILFIPIRGSVTTSTANVGMVYFSQNQFLNHSAINPCFSLFASLSKQQDFASQFNFFPETEMKDEFRSDTTVYSAVVEITSDLIENPDGAAIYTRKEIPQGLSQEEFREALIKERALELGYEEVRWFDLVRWGRSQDFTKKLYGLQSTGVGGTLTNPESFTFTVTELASRNWAINWDTKWYLAAFPQTEVDKGYGIVQNPGW